MTDGGSRRSARVTRRAFLIAAGAAAGGFTARSLWRMESGNALTFADVQRLGAAGDGQTDDTAAVQSAIDRVAMNGGGTVFFPPGRYRLSDSDGDRSALRVHGNDIVIKGAGRNVSFLELSPGADAHVLSILGRNISVTDLAVRARGHLQTLRVHGIRADGDSLTFARLTIRGAAHYGMGLGQSSGIRHTRVVDVRIFRSGADGIDIKNKRSDNISNQISGVIVGQFGLNAALPRQAGVDCRGPVLVSDVSVLLKGDDVGLRLRRGTRDEPNGIGADGARVAGVEVTGVPDRAGHQGSCGVVIEAPDVTIRESRLSTSDYGFLICGPRALVAQAVAQGTNAAAFFVADDDNCDGDMARLQMCVAEGNAGDAFVVEADDVSVSGSRARFNSGVGLRLSPQAGGFRSTASEFGSREVSLVTSRPSLLEHLA